MTILFSDKTSIETTYSDNIDFIGKFANLKNVGIIKFINDADRIMCFNYSFVNEVYTYSGIGSSTIIYISINNIKYHINMDLFIKPNGVMDLIEYMLNSKFKISLKF